MEPDEIWKVQFTKYIIKEEVQPPAGRLTARGKNGGVVNTK